MSSSPRVPHGVTATGVQRAIGERRRRRLQEREGRLVALDETMSSWPTPDPPTRARPVVRPRRGQPGAATQPVLPTPEIALVRQLTVHAAPSSGRGDRRSRRQGTAAGGDTGMFGPVAVAAAAGPAVGATGSGATPGLTVVPGPHGSTRAPLAPARRRTGAFGFPAPAGTTHATDADGTTEATGTTGATGSAGSGEVPAAPGERDPFHPVRPGQAHLATGRQPVGRSWRRDDDQIDAVPAARAIARPAVAVAAPQSAAAVPVRPAESLRAAGPDGAPEDEVPPGRRAQRRGEPSAGAGPGWASHGPASAVPPRPGSFGSGTGTGVGGSSRWGGPDSDLDDLDDLTDMAETRGRGLLGRVRGLAGRPVVAVTAAALLVLVVVLVTVVLALRGRDDAADQALVPSSAPRQDTVLIGVLTPEGTLSRALLLSIGTDGGPVVPLVMPGNLAVTVPDSGAMTLAQSVTVDPQAPDRAVEDALGVRVDGTWILDPQTLIAQVDAAGGIEVDVAQAVTAGAVTVPVGPQLLTGAQAAAYAVPQAGEGPDSALDRFGQVILGLVAALPADEGDVTQQLSTVDRSPDTTITSQELSSLLARGSSSLSAVPVMASAVPTLPSTTDGGPVPVDRVAATALLEQQLPGALLPVSVAGALDVVVGNATEQPGLVTQARDRLVAGGLRFVGGGTLSNPDVTATKVIVAADTPENRQRGLAVAEALGVPDAELAVKENFTTDVPEGTDIIVWLGSDFASLAAGGAS